MAICTRKLEFTIQGEIDTKVLVEEGDFNNDGSTDLKFTVTVDESGGNTADLRLLAWDVSDENKLPTMAVYLPSSPHITDQRFQANSVVDLGNGANLQGPITAGGKGFDAGVEIGTEGIAKDDIQSTTFVVMSSSGNLTLDDIGGQRFGVRLTSYGETSGSRNDSLKISDFAPYAPDAIDDSLTTDEDTAASLNLLANDTDGDNDPLSVTAIEGGTVGSAFNVVSEGGRTAVVTAQADGTFNVDPDGGFEDLSTGESDNFDLEYTISDGNGGEDCATVTVTIEGINDAPVAVDDPAFYVEFGDVAFADVAANDTDVDGTIDATTLAFSGADHGTAEEDGGKLKYTANTLLYDFVDSSVADALTYTVQDNEGATSNPANVTAKVIDPMRETDIDSQNASNGQPLSIELSTEDRTFNDSSFVEIDILSGQLAQTVNVSFIADGSGSVSAPEYNQQVIAIQNTINALRADYQGSAADVNVQLVQFSSGSSAASFDLFDTALDDVNTGTPLRPYQNGGSTNYDAPLSDAVNFFTGKGADDNFLLFASDGNPNTGGAFTDEVTELNNLNVSITAVGFGDNISLTTLNQIDNTNGAQIVQTAAELGDVFADSPLFPADLLDFSLTVNGNEVANESNLVDLGGGDYSFGGTLTGLLHSLGDTNEVVALASFDINNDGVADEFRTANTFINGTDGSDILFA